MQIKNSAKNISEKEFLMFLDKKAQLTLAPMLMAPICNTSHSTQPSQTSQKPYATMLGIKLDMSISYQLRGRYPSRRSAD